MQKNTIFALLAAASLSGCGIVLGLNDYSDTGSSGSGGPTVCAPNETKTCAYGGPVGALDHSPCKQGTQVCQDDGTGFGPCEGEILPLDKEDCTNEIDDDCNGMVNDACPCDPGTTEPCYEGPDGTQTHLPCKAGTHTCQADGKSFGPCTGQVQPHAEDCTTPEDDDCDGTPNQASEGCVCLPGTTASCYTGPAGTENTGQCVDGLETCTADGKGYGTCAGQILPGTEDCSNALDEDCSGTYCTEALWSKDFGDQASQSVEAIAKDAQDNIFIAGYFQGAFNVGGTMLSASGGSDVFVAKLDAAGNVLWAKQFGLANDQYASDIAVDSMGNVVVAGNFLGSISFDGGMTTLTATAGGPAFSYDMFVAKLDTDGNHIWSKRFGDLNDQGLRSIALDGQDAVLLTGNFQGSFSFSVGTVTAAAGAGNNDIFVAKLNKNGTGVWAKSYGDAPAYQSGLGVVSDAAGNVTFVASLKGTVTIGPFQYTGSAAGDYVVARLDATGTPVWSQWASAGASGSILGGIARDNNGSILVSGAFLGSMEFVPGLPGTKKLVNAGVARNVFVAKYAAANGVVSWVTQLGANVPQSGDHMTVYSVAADTNNNVFVMGGCYGAFNLGFNAPCGNISHTPFLAKLDSMGATVWGRTYGIDSGSIQDAVYSPGKLFLAAYNTKFMNFGNGVMNTAGQGDIAVGLISPE